MDRMDLMDHSKWLDPDLDKKMPRNIDLKQFLSKASASENHVNLMDSMDLMDHSKWLDPDLDKKMHRNVDLRPFLNTCWESIRNQISRAPQLEPIGSP